MQNTLLYLVTVLIWGSTWIAIEFQLGDVAIEASLFYRFALSAVLMWLFCWWRRLPMRFSPTDHGFIALLAILNFALNYLLIYQAQQHLTSAMAAIAFTTMLLMNIINTRLFFGNPVAKRIYFGALMGIAGIAVLFYPDLDGLDLTNASLLGLLLVLGSALSASLGNMVSVRNSRAGLPIMQVNAWGMLYGSIALALLVWLSGKPFGFSTSPSFILSLLYLAVFGSVIAFATYFALLKRMGPEKASYVIVLFPLVAVVLSTLFEGFVWTGYTFAGFALVLAGNALVLTPFAKIKALLFKPKLPVQPILP
ncbi:Threonine/homoserine efflux transporter RhtA [Arsukibacterium tuosuense]|uniref:Threonine/homoserine efflux transporter RhtA n=1 Tax=Arsukibacterium tuosuense TaxID=1323745 RepID=A0A285IWN4_9GAMM|nr:EamA family transporter [Arsukibacterium tuosuense]SNY52233.1 Threonine/homoserine efflux transporter RhtA [Arsukibacterium tuosuense]